MRFNNTLVLLCLAASSSASKGKIDEKKLLRGQKALPNDVFVLHEIDRKLASGSKYGDDYKSSGSNYGDDYKSSGSKYGDDYKNSGSKYGDDYKSSGSKYGDDSKSSGSKYGDGSSGGSKTTSSSSRSEKGVACGGSSKANSGLSTGKTSSTSSSSSMDIAKSTNCIDALKVGDDVFKTTVNSPLDINEGDIFKNDQHSKLNTLSVETCSDPAVGTLKRNVGSFVYFPEPDFVGLTTFECLISDGLLTDTALITIHVAGNLSPTLAVDDNVDLMEDTPTVIDPKINDAEDVTIYSYSKPIHGSIVSNGDGTLTYVPDENYYGPDKFEYTVTDGTNTDIANVYINVSPVVDLPVAIPDEVTTPQDQAVVIDVLENDSDPDGNDISVASHTQPADGTIVSDGETITYTPDPGFVGQDTFEYTISDSEGETATTTVLITVEAVNSVPVAIPDEVTTPQDQAVVINVLENDSDPDGSDISVASHTQPADGIVVSDGETITYTPDPGFVGQDTFEYTISDSEGGTATTTVLVTVEAVNSAPVTMDLILDTLVLAPLAITLQDILGDAYDPDGDKLNVDRCEQPQNGVLGNDLTYTPNTGFVGQDSFRCLICDTNNACEFTTVYINVRVNSVPVAIPDEVTTPQDQAVVINVLENDSDPDGNDISVASHTQPADGTIVSDGETITYTPDPGFVGQDTFEYTISDSEGETATTIVLITVEAVNSVPVAIPDEVTTPQDQAVVIDVLKNDSDPDGSDISVASHTQPADGIVVSDGNTITYTPDPGFVGQDTFEYTISDSDSEGGTATTTVLVTVEAVNSAPVTMDLTLDTLVLAPLAITLQDILGDAYDPDGDKLNVDRCEQPQNGVLGNDLTYTPNTGFVGQDSFRCLICDTNNACEFTTVYINVNAMSPTAEDDEFTTEIDVALELAVLSNDISPNNDVLSLNTFTQPENGVLSVGNDGSLLYTPNSGFVGQDTFTYKAITEGTKQSSNEATVTINIVAEEPGDDMILVLSEVVYANLPPNVADITLATTAQVPLPITVQDIIANTNDPDGDELTVTQCDQPENGVLGQDLTYTSNAGFVGTDSFMCTVCDDDNACGTVNVFILVNAAAPSPPNAVDDTYTTDQDTPIILDLLANDSPLGVTLTDFTQPVYGTLTENNDGTFTYTPDDRTEGVDTFIDMFEYIIVNESGRSTGKVRITVNAVAAPPSAQNDYYSTFVNTPLTIDASVGVLSNDGDQLVVTSVIRQPSNGVLSQREDGSFTYIPQQWWIGTDTYEYEVTATDGQTATATVSITIQQPTAMIIPGGGTIGRNGTSSDCKQGFTDCRGVNTVSTSLRGKNP